MKILISIDITLSEEARQEKLQILKRKFPDADMETIAVIPLSLASYLELRTEFDLLVVFVAGYNLENYFHNLLFHLLFFQGSIYGMNVENHLFQIPRIPCLKLICKRKLEVLMASFVTLLYALARFR